MPFSFSTALSGLRASTEAIGVAGNNIANANTTAFKSGSITFSDIFSDSLGVRLNGAGTPLQVGGGVRTAAIATNFSQGSLIESGSTSAAIQGSGFFVVKDASGAKSYTRAGDFSLDNEGFLLTPGGERVQGYAAVNGAIPPGSLIADVKFPVGETLAPHATTSAALRLNLNSADTAGSAFHAPVQVFDSKGVSHTLDMVYAKQPDGSFLMNVTMDGTTAQTNVDGGGANSAPVSFKFDANGLLTSPKSLVILPDQTTLSGAALPSIDIGLNVKNPDGTLGEGIVTNFAAASAVASTLQDGFAAGTLAGISLSTDSSGTVYSVFSNGETRPVAQFAVANFNAQTGLRHTGGNLYQETPASGQPSIGQAGTGGRGQVVGGMLEQSNVDLAGEFTSLIVAQRGFQANSRVITTINQTMQDLIQSI
jgi:flagellar hook protein FlgE